MLRRVRNAVLIVVLVALLPATNAAASAGTTWKTHRSAAGFSVSAPSTWVDITSLTPDVIAKLSQVPSLSSYVDLVRNTKSIKLMLADVGPTAVTNRFSTNVNVIQAPTIGDLELHRQVEVAQLKATGLVVGAVRSSIVTLPAGPSLDVSYRARYSPGSRAISILQFIFIRNGEETALTYTTLPQLQSRYRPTFLRSARTFRFR